MAGDAAAAVDGAASPSASVTVNVAKVQRRAVAEDSEPPSLPGGGSSLLQSAPSSTTSGAVAPEAAGLPDFNEFLGWAKTRSKEELAHQLHRVLKLLVTLGILNVRIPFARQRLLLEGGEANAGAAAAGRGDDGLDGTTPAAIACLALNPALCPPHNAPLLSIPLFSDLGRYERNFDEVACIGRGAFGAVFSARHKLDRCLYAVKKVKIKPRFPMERLLNLDVRGLGELEHVRQLLREVTILARVGSHENLVRYHQAWIEPQFDCPGRPAGPAGPAWRPEGSGWEESATESGAETTAGASRGGPCRPSPLRVEVLPSDSERSSPPPPARALRPARAPDESAASASASARAPGGSSRRPRGPRRAARARRAYLPAIAARRRSIPGPSDPDWPSSPASPASPPPREALALVPARARRAASLVPCPAHFVLFIQMALCEGATLHEWLAERNRRGGVEREANLRIFVQLLRGVAHIHAQKIIHRDLKPANIFLEPSGRLKIGDFGLSTELAGAPSTPSSSPPDTPASASASASASRGTRDVGTPSYAPPETRLGTFCEASDIFSCGVILLELFCVLGTGMERAGVLAEMRAGSLPARLHRDFPLEASLVLWMTKPSPAERPAATTVLEQLTCARVWPALPAPAGAEEGRGRGPCGARLEEELERRGRRIAALEEEVSRLRAQLASLSPPAPAPAPRPAPPLSPLSLSSPGEGAHKSPEASA
eukprot:tig00001574_g9349.t1